MIFVQLYTSIAGNAYLIYVSLCRKLAVIQVGVEATLIKKRYMVTLLYDVSILHNKYHISIFYRR